MGAHHDGLGGFGQFHDATVGALGALGIAGLGNGGFAMHAGIDELGEPAHGFDAARCVGGMDGLDSEGVQQGNECLALTATAARKWPIRIIATVEVRPFHRLGVP